VVPVPVVPVVPVVMVVVVVAVLSEYRSGFLRRLRLRPS
jgi:hypothetical protein